MIRSILFGIVCIPTALIAADVYRTVDKHGNAIFSDRPSPGAEHVEITVKESLAPPKAKRFEYTPDIAAENNTPVVYETFDIASPENNQTFRAAASDAISITFTLQPALDTKQGHRILLYVDGDKHTELSAPLFTLTELERGEHTVSAELVDADSALLKRAVAVKFFVFRPQVTSNNKEDGSGAPPSTATTGNDVTPTETQVPPPTL